MAVVLEVPPSGSYFWLGFEAQDLLAHFPAKTYLKIKISTKPIISHVQSIENFLLMFPENIAVKLLPHVGPAYTPKYPLCEKGPQLTTPHGTYVPQSGEI